MGVATTILGYMITSKLGCSEDIANHINFWAGTAVYSIAIYAMYLIEQKNKKITTSEKDSFEINEENILKIV